MPVKKTTTGKGTKKKGSSSSEGPGATKGAGSRGKASAAATKPAGGPADKKGGRQSARPAASSDHGTSKTRGGKALTGAAVSSPNRSGTRPKGGNGQAAKESGEPKLVTTYLKPEDLAEFRELLIAKRNELVGDVNHLESEARRENGGATGSSSMPIHMADLGSDTWEQELTFGLLENERGLLREIDEALDRIEDKTYGICLATQKRITKSRLRAKPWAKYCIEYARQRELGRA